MTWPLLIVLLSIALSGFFSGMEIAFVSSSKVRAEMDIARGGIIDRVINVFYSHREMFISTLLVGNNIVNVVYSIAMAQLLTVPLRPWVAGNDFMELLLITAISAIIILLTGEYLPKAVFRINPNYSLRTFSLPLFVCYCLLYPVSRFMQLLSAWLMRLLGLKVQNERLGLITVDELDAYLQENIDKHEDENKEVEHEVKLFENALDFSETKVRDCMVPRNEICAVE